MKTLLVAVLLVVGCGSSDSMQGMMATPSHDPLDLTWTIKFSGGLWFCNGTMNTRSVINDALTIDMTGSWNCSGFNTQAAPVTMGGSLTGNYVPGPETIRLTLASAAATIPIDGSMGPGGIVGTARVSGSSVPFTAF